MPLNEHSEPNRKHRMDRKLELTAIDLDPVGQLMCKRKVVSPAVLGASRTYFLHPGHRAHLMKWRGAFSQFSRGRGPGR